MQRQIRKTVFTFGVLAFLVPSLSLAGPFESTGCLVGSPPATTTTVLDVLALVPPQLAGQASHAQRWFENRLIEANQVFANSGLNAFYCLKAVETIEGEGLDFSSANDTTCSADSEFCAAALGLAWLNSEPGEVLDSRNQYGADFVVLLVPTHPDPTQDDRRCGRANLVHRNEDGVEVFGGTDGPPFLGRAYSTLKFDPDENRCPIEAWTLPHELGHNLGLFHNESSSGVSQAPPFPIDPRGEGFLIDIPDLPTPPLATLMGCDAMAHPRCDRRVPYFSNPAQPILPSNHGVPYGSPVYIGDSNHNSVQAVRNRLPVAEHHAEPPGIDAPPWVRFELPESAEALSPLHLAARVGDPPPTASVGKLEIEWRYSDPPITLPSQPTLTVDLVRAGTQTVTATVTDAHGQMATWSEDLFVCWPPDSEEGPEDGLGEHRAEDLARALVERDRNFHTSPSTNIYCDFGVDDDWAKVVAAKNGVPTAGTLVALARDRETRASDISIEIYAGSSNCESLQDPLTPNATGINRATFAVDAVNAGKCFYVRYSNAIFDNWGHQTSYTQRIYLDTPPRAAFSVQCTGSRCDFDASASSNDRGTLDYHWTFGDGTSEVTSEPQASHCYGAGTFTATLTVVDRENQSDSTSRQVSVAVGTGVPTKGLWANPNRSGTGYGFVEHTSGNYALAWFTYEADGRPTWYLSGVGPMGQCWRQPLYRSQWTAGTAQSTEVGWIELTSTGAQTATVSWELDGVAGEEPIELFQASMGRAGAWADPGEDGWAIEIEESANHLAAYVLFYGNDGKPLWTLGTASATATGWQGLPMVIFDGVGLCPSCSGGSATPPPSQGAGAINLNVAAGTSSGQAALQITTPYGNWIRGTIPIVRLTLP